MRLLLCSFSLLVILFSLLTCTEQEDKGSEAKSFGFFSSSKEWKDVRFDDYCKNLTWTKSNTVNDLMGDTLTVEVITDTEEERSISVVFPVELDGEEELKYTYIMKYEGDQVVVDNMTTSRRVFPAVWQMDISFKYNYNDYKWCTSDHYQYDLIGPRTKVEADISGNQKTATLEGNQFTMTKESDESYIVTDAEGDQLYPETDTSPSSTEVCTRDIRDHIWDKYFKGKWNCDNNLDSCYHNAEYNELGIDKGIYAKCCEQEVKFCGDATKRD